MAEGLSDRGHEVHVVTYPFGSGPVADGLALHRVASRGSRHRTTPGPSLGKLLVLDPRLARELRRVVRAGRIEIVYAHHYEGLLVGLAARSGTGVPVVYDAHTLLESELPTYAPRIPRWTKTAVAVRLDRWLPPKADHVIAVSDTIRQHLLAETSLREDRVTTVSNGVEHTLFSGNAPERDRERPPTVVFTGNLAAYQGIDLLLEAFQKVRAVRPDVRLRIVTESSFAPYEDRARALGIREGIDVVVTGFDEVPGFLATADVAVNPRPDCDGIPLKLLNYMAAARPVVSFRGSAPGVEHGRNGWLVDKGDVSGFARGIQALVDDPKMARAIGERSRRHVEEHHSWAAMSEAAELVFRSVLRRAREDA